MRSHLYPVAQDVVLTLVLWNGAIGCFWPYGNGVMRNPALGFQRLNLPGTLVNRLQGEPHRKIQRRFIAMACAET
jgi:hypothetical protein